MEDEDLLDEDTIIVPNTAQQETPNTFGRNLLQRLGNAHGHSGQRPLAPNPHLIQIVFVSACMGHQTLQAMKCSVIKRF